MCASRAAIGSRGSLLLRRGARPIQGAPGEAFLARGQRLKGDCVDASRLAATVLGIGCRALGGGSLPGRRDGFRFACRLGRGRVGGGRFSRATTFGGAQFIVTACGTVVSVDMNRLAIVVDVAVGLGGRVGSSWRLRSSVREALVIGFDASVCRSWRPGGAGFDLSRRQEMGSRRGHMGFGIGALMGCFGWHAVVGRGLAHSSNVEEPGSAGGVISATRTFGGVKTRSASF